MDLLAAFQWSSMRALEFEASLPKGPSILERMLIASKWTHVICDESTPFESGLNAKCIFREICHNCQESMHKRGSLLQPSGSILAELVQLPSRTLACKALQSSCQHLCRQEKKQSPDATICKSILVSACSVMSLICPQRMVDFVSYISQLECFLCSARQMTMRLQGQRRKQKRSYDNALFDDLDDLPNDHSLHKRPSKRASTKHPKRKKRQR